MQAPELSISHWFNTDQDVTLGILRGRVVVIEAFQMLCPGCVLHGIPLAQSIQRTFAGDQVAVIGIHTVFEHHEAMTPVSLKAFLHEYRISFPVGVDKPGAGPLPETMAAFDMRGTPSLIVLDQAGQIAAHHFGQVSEMQIGAQIATLLANGPKVADQVDQSPSGDACELGGCD